MPTIKSNAYKAGDVISHGEMCYREGKMLQRGMNYHLRNNISVILMSLRNNAPYNDQVLDNGRVLIYEGHDAPKERGGPDPKTIDQPLFTPKGTITQNGKFFAAAQKCKKNIELIELVNVYENIRPGFWVYNGLFTLIDAWQESINSRKVCKFKLEVISESPEDNVINHEPEHNRIIPSSIKLAVRKRDKGRCVSCGSQVNLHFDHVIPFSRGGSSLLADNVQLLCAMHNLSKRDKIQ
jgi:hypothetical protein